MERFVRFFVERHLLVNVVTAVIIVSGVMSALRMPMEGFPAFDLPILFVRAQLPGASARDIETKVTIPIEEAVEELDNVEIYHTEISENISVTTVELYYDINHAAILEAERDLRSELDAITDFPDDMVDEPVIETMNRGRFPILEIALAGPTALLPEASDRLETTIKRIPLVGKVTTVGLPDPEVRILVDPERAREHGVTLLDVASAIDAHNVSSTGGILESGSDRRQVVLWNRFLEPENVGEVVLRLSPDGGRVRVTDVARIERGREDTGLRVHTNGQPGVTLVVRKRENSDVVQTEREVLAALATSPLPDGVTATVVNDEAFFAANRLKVMGVNGLIGITLVAASVFLFLSPSAALWVCVGVPVVFLGVLFCMPHLGITLNIMSTSALVVVLGMLVDDAVVVAEKILAFRQKGKNAIDAAVAGACAMARPVFASAITTFLAFSPMFAMGGMPGKVSWYLPAVVVLSLALSLAESFILLPSHMSMLRARSSPKGKRAFVLALESAYRRAIERVLFHRTRAIVCFTLAFVALFLFVAPRTGFSLFPQTDAQNIFIKVTLPPGTPIERTEAAVASLEQQLPAILGNDMLATTARIGHMDPESVDREFGAAENEAVVTIGLIPYGRTYSPTEWVRIIKNQLQIPDDAGLVYQVQIMGPPVGRAVTIYVAGADNRARRATAAGIERWLSQHPELVDVEIDERPGTRQVNLELDPEKLALRDLDARTVGRTLKAAFYGIEASDHRDLDETTAFRVLLEPSFRRSLDALLDTPVRNRRGELVSLRDVVQPTETAAVSRIFHRNGQRTATVTAEIAAGSGENAESMAQFLENALIPRYADREGVSVTLGGEAVKTRETTGELRGIALLAFVGIGVVIALMLGSFLEAFFVMSVVPFALLGVLVAFYLHGKEMSLFAMMGTIGLAGVVVNASIVMVDAIHREVGGLVNPSAEVRQSALVETVVGRMRPILVTALSTVGGVLPLAYGLGGYDAILSPMSLALGWGILISTPVTLFLVPCFYTLANDLRSRSH